MVKRNWILFFLLLFLLPTQLSKHFFTDNSIIYGIRVDYLLPQIYITDIIIFILFIYYVILKKDKLRNYISKKYLIPVILIGLFLVFNFVFSIDKISWLLKFLKLIEVIFIVSYIMFENISYKQSFRILALCIFYTSGLAIWQFINQASIGGLFWFLGERMISIYTPGAAKAEILGKLYLRSYSTFSHPNSFAGFLTILSPILLTMALISNNRTDKIFYFVVSILLLIALILTFSRLSITLTLSGIVIILYWFFKNKIISKKIITIWTLILFVFLLGFNKMIYFRFTSLFIDNLTLVQRLELNSATLKIIKDNYIFGVGLNNFLIHLPVYSEYAKTHAFYQPAHNTFLLIAAETGFLGLSLSLFLFYKLFQIIIRKKSIFKVVYLIVYFQILILFMFDHYFFTLQQNILLFAVIIGFMIKKEERNV